MSERLLEVVGVSKSFGGVPALRDVGFSLAPGEVLALAGDNGAGKSTLIKIIAGALRPDAGEIRFQGRAVRFDTPQQARAAGIETIYQDLALADNLDAGANVFLGREPKKRILGFPVIDRERMRVLTRKSLARLGIEIAAIDRPVRQLSGGERQAISIARAIQGNAKLLIMDEPTAALATPGRQKLAALIAALKSNGTGVIFISHNLADTFAVADRILVLRSGILAGERNLADTDPDDVARLMAGG